LKANQQPNGSWKCPRSDPAVSALATLAFLGHGDTPDSEEFGPTVNRALQYVVSTVGENGAVKPANMYAQGAVMLALAEAYGMTQSPLVKEPLDRMVAAVITSQNVAKKNRADTGGWRYTLGATDADVSVSGWIIMGLKSARLAGVSVPDEVFAKSSQYLWNMYSDQGGFGYSSPGAKPNTTAIGVLCQQFLGHSDDKRIKKALDTLKEQKFDWKNPPGGHGVYGWYYMTQAMFQGGGSYWTYWNSQFRDALVKAQEADGRWETKGKEAELGPVYSTTLSCLMLEVYYRYLPIYQEMEKKNFTTPGPSATAK
jgi:hypothetical protein